MKNTLTRFGLVAVSCLLALFCAMPMPVSADIPPDDPLQPYERPLPPDEQPKKGCGSTAWAEITVLCLAGIAGITLIRITKRGTKKESDEENNTADREKFNE